MMEKRVIDWIRKHEPLPQGTTDKSIVRTYEGSLYAAGILLRLRWEDFRKVVVNAFRGRGDK